MVVFADWHLSLSNVQSMKEFTAVLTAYTSLAVIFEISEIGAVPFLILNYLTNIFTYLYFSLFYLVLTKSVNVEKKQAIIVTVIYAIISGLMYILLSLPYIFM